MKKNGVKNIRIKLGMSQGEFAKAIGKKWPSTVSNYETGARTPDGNTAWAIIDLLIKRGYQASLEDIYIRD